MSYVLEEDWRWNEAERPAGLKVNLEKDNSGIQIYPAFWCPLETGRPHLLLCSVFRYVGNTLESIVTTTVRVCRQDLGILHLDCIIEIALRYDGDGGGGGSVH